MGTPGDNQSTGGSDYSDDVSVEWVELVELLSVVTSQ